MIGSFHSSFPTICHGPLPPEHPMPKPRCCQSQKTAALSCSPSPLRWDTPFNNRLHSRYSCGPREVFLGGSWLLTSLRSWVTWELGIHLLSKYSSERVCLSKYPSLLLDWESLGKRGFVFAPGSWSLPNLKYVCERASSLKGHLPSDHIHQIYQFVPHTLIIKPTRMFKFGSQWWNMIFWVLTF